MDELKNKVDAISPTFCAAKWLQVTIDLYHGLTKSCHHTQFHEIDLKALETDLSALHNTKKKHDQRTMMLNGQRPSDCDYCWKVEDSKEGALSDRHYKSSAYWARHHYDRIHENKDTGPVVPTYIEVIFDNVCNLRCTYCSSDSSSTIEKEINTFGPYSDGLDNHRKKRYAKSDVEKLHKAFWQWLPSIYKKLDTLRISGGEPLLSDAVFNLFDFFSTREAKQLVIAINSNLGIPMKRYNDFKAKLKKLVDADNLMLIQLFTSIDTFGDDAELIRGNLNFEEFRTKLRDFVETFQTVEVVIMATYGQLSIYNFRRFIEEVIELKKIHSRVILDISYLDQPDFLSIRIIYPHEIPFIQEAVDLMEEYHGIYFKDEEVNKMKRILALAKMFSKENHIYKRKQFHKYLEEYKERSI